MQRAAGLERIRISGGLSRCDYLCRAVSDLAGLAVDRYALHEATARGVAFLAAGEPADWRDPPVERSFTPSANDALASRFVRWRAEMARRGAVA
jgi:glycerol kinase